MRDKNDKPISIPTLEKHFKKEIQHGAVKLNSMVGNFMVNTILGRDPPEGSKIVPITDEKARAGLLVLYARARLKWSDTTKVEGTGKDGAIVVQFAKADENL